ncbi:alpha/beta fold hydrolase [Streptomyces sp. NPDC050504]|uniref:alpha/beta fold hydrolase n=1 Tax=Streptomyces sp. NPDC050504 TaxID=3365618 RepID=UPI00379D8688
MPELKVDGATLHYEVRGTGPVLLLIPGGGGEAAVFDRLAAGLTDRFTVVAHDPRGHSRSALEGPVADQRVEEHSEDVHRLIEEVAPDGEPVSVLGASSGAIVALDLLARHPERLRTVVAHEPQTVGVLPDAERHEALFARVVAAYRKDGLGAAMTVMGAGVGAELPATDRELGEGELPYPPEVMERVMANMPFFLERELRQFSAYVPDTAALAAGPARLVLAGGRDSKEQTLRRPVEELARLLGTETVVFPGGHTGTSSHPAAFARKLVEVLNGR